ncbi:MAG TPA: phosphotransferase [Bacillales bacterium]|nr:phosphotransferase [Bacillales bacterium]
MDEVVRELSEKDSTHRVHLVKHPKHGEIVKKTFFDPVTFKREIEAVKAIDRTMRPVVYKIDVRRRCLYMSYQPLEEAFDCANKDLAAAALMKQLHHTTRRYGAVYDPGTGEHFTTWKDYLAHAFRKPVESLRDWIAVGERLEEKLAQLKDSPYTPLAYIHGDFRFANIGERNGRLLLFDFDRSMIGDPYWDVAQYAFESARCKSRFYEAYGVEDVAKADAHVWFVALQKAAKLAKSDRTDSNGFAKCMGVLKNGGKA